MSFSSFASELSAVEDPSCRVDNDLRISEISSKMTPLEFRHASVAAPADSKDFLSTPKSPSLAGYDNWSEDLEDAINTALQSNYVRTELLASPSAPSYHSTETHPPFYGSSDLNQAVHSHSHPISATKILPKIASPWQTSILSPFPRPIAIRHRSSTLPTLGPSPLTAQNRKQISVPIHSNIDTSDLVKTLHEVLNEQPSVVTNLVETLRKVSQGLMEAFELTLHLRQQQAFVNFPDELNSDVTRNEGSRIREAKRTDHRLTSPYNAPQAPPPTHSVHHERNEVERVRQHDHASLGATSPLKILNADTKVNEKDSVRDKDGKEGLRVPSPFAADFAPRGVTMSDILLGKQAMADVLNIAPTPVSRGHAPKCVTSSASPYTKVAAQTRKPEFQPHDSSSNSFKADFKSEAPIAVQHLKPEPHRSTTRPIPSQQIVTRVQLPSRPGTAIP
jgi:hypothetical protein